MQLLACAMALLAARQPVIPQGMVGSGRTARHAPPVETRVPSLPLDFQDVAAEAGLVDVHVSGHPESKRYILETTGSGVAIFDFDNDNRPDLFWVNGGTWESAAGRRAPTSRLYRNLGGLRFEDVTENAGLARSGWGQGACAADYDNDGLRDLFVTYYGQSVLYRNRGDGTFQDVTRAAGLVSERVRWDTGCSFFDYDLDGRLDLAVAEYLDFDRRNVPEPGSSGYCQWKGLPVLCGPRGLPFGRNRLFHNEGGGRFRDVSEVSGIAKTTGCYGFTVISSDFDNDGWPDLYVACDSTPSLLYRNLGNGTFEEIGIPAGVALNEDGQEQAGMGVAAADYDEDGFVDIAKTNFSDDVPNLYRNNGDGTFTDLVNVAGLGLHAAYVGWGVHFLDVDNDGRKDLFLVNGHVYPEVDRASFGARFRQPRLLFWNAGNGRFVDVSSQAGEGVRQLRVSRGSAHGDLDNDGSLEIVVNNLGDRPSLLKNRAQPRGNWLLVRCVGTASNRDAVGARVFVYAGGRRLSGEIQTGSSFLSQNDARLHFGLGPSEVYDRIEVLWPGGTRQSFGGGPANRVVTLVQGR